MYVTNVEKSAHEYKIKNQAVHIKSYNLILRFLRFKQINFDID